MLVPRLVPPENVDFIGFLAIYGTRDKKIKQNNSTEKTICYQEKRRNKCKK
jgi:hypothetical protein